MERRSPIKDVYKIIKQDLPELYKVLEQKLGVDNPFSRLNVGGGFYLWADNRSQWRQMISADDITQGLVRDSLIKKKEEIGARLGTQTAEMLFTIPDDSYIYYSDDDGQIKILLTGWGFKKPVNISGGPDVHHISSHNPVTLSFIYDNEKLTSFEFGLVLYSEGKEHLNRLVTDAAGTYKFNDIKVGQTLILRDLTSGQNYSIQILSGQSHYEIDITRYSILTVKAESDDMPVSGERVTVRYREKEYSSLTDTDGNASFKLPYHEGESIEAVLRDEHQSELIDLKGNNVVFSFISPVVALNAIIEVRVLDNDEPVPGETVSIEYGGVIYDGNTDEEGVLIYTIQFDNGTRCNVSVPGFESQTKELSVEQKTTFRFERRKETEFFAPRIKIVDDCGLTRSSYPISVDYDGLNEYISDENGIVQMPEMEAGKSMSVIDGLHSDNFAEYELEIDCLEYVFKVPCQQEPEVPDVKVMLRDASYMPIICGQVRFQQGDVEYLAPVDTEGVALIPSGTFITGEQPIMATLLDAGRDYPVIPFTLEPEEYEYVLQEKGSNPSSWTKVLPIIFLLLTILAMLFLWPLFAGFCAGIFDVIYH